MNERAKDVLLGLLVLLALAAFVAMGGDGGDLEDHAAWMEGAKARGEWVMW